MRRQNKMMYTQFNVYLQDISKNLRNQTLAILTLQNMQQKKRSVHRLNNNSKTPMKYTGLRNYLKVKKIVIE